MKITVINGPNLNMLGIRERDIYGEESYEALVRGVEEYCRSADIDVEFFQSNHEGDLIDKIQSCYEKTDGIIINPAAYTHTSIALADALRAVSLPAVEVHLTDTDRREPYRRISYVREACIATVKGRGFRGYTDAVDVLKEHINGR